MESVAPKRGTEELGTKGVGCWEGRERGGGANMITLETENALEHRQTTRVEDVNFGITFRRSNFAGFETAMDELSDLDGKDGSGKV